MREKSLGMRMTPEQYFKVHERSSPTLYDDQREVRSLATGTGYVQGRAIGIPMEIAEFPNQTNHTAIIIGVVAVVAIVGMVVLGLAFLSRKG